MATTTVIAASIAAVISFMILEPIYAVHTTLFVGKEGGGLSDDILGFSSELLNVNSKLVGDYREIAKSRLVAKEVIKDLELDYSVGEFQDKVQVDTVRDTRIFKISFEDPNPERVTSIVNRLAEVLMKHAKEIVLVENITVIDKAEVPVEPIKPNKRMNVAIGGILGAMLGTMIIFMIHFLDNTIKTPVDVEKALGLSVLGTIPTFEGEVRR